jgi:hypothetical protein
MDAIKRFLQRAIDEAENGNEDFRVSLVTRSNKAQWFQISWDGGVAQVVEIRKRRSLQLGTNQDAAPASAEESTPCATLPPLHPHCRT